jgi:hypothetical protein
VAADASHNIQENILRSTAASGGWKAVNQCFEHNLCPRRQGVDCEETDGVDDEGRDGVDDEDTDGVDDKERDGLRNVCLITIQPPDTASSLGIFYWI